MKFDNLQQAIDAARGMLESEQPDRSLYAEVENYVIANGSRLGADPKYGELRAAADAVAEKFGFPTISSIQENFGLNSCAQ